MSILPVGNQISSGSTALDKVSSGNFLPQTIRTAAPAESSNPVAPSDSAKKTTTFEQVTKAVQDINKTIQATHQGLEFSVDNGSHEVVVKLIDQQTKQVLRQIPTQEALEIAKSLDKLQGLLIKQTA